MIRSSLLLFVSLICLLPAQSQTTEETLKQLSVEWMQALVKKDSAALERILAPSYTLGAAGEDSKVDRATWLKNAYGKDWTQTHYHFIDVQATDADAIVNSKMSFKVNPVPFTITSDLIDHWVFRDGRWQVTGRYVGGDSITSFINGAIGFLFGTALTLVIVWIRRKYKKRKVNSMVS